MDALNIIKESFCERILQAHVNDTNIQILEIKKELATSKGDNYLNEIYRIIVKYNTKNIKETNLIVKINLPNSGSGSEILDEAFRNEIHIFTKVLPRIEKYVGCSLSPFLFYMDENLNYIVLEDVGKKGCIILLEIDTKAYLLNIVSDL